VEVMKYDKKINGKEIKLNNKLSIKKKGLKDMKEFKPKKQ
jgi:hypothetical protein